MTPDEAKQVLAAARQSADLHQWEDIDHLLRHVYEANLLTGTDQGDAAYLLGLSYLRTNAIDAAHQMFTIAVSTAGAEDRAKAQQGLAELDRHDTAVDSEVEGVNQTESAGVLAAGDDALAGGDLDGAYGHYWSVYDGTADPQPRAKAALGIARVFAHRGDLVQAGQYAEYVEHTGVTGPAGDAKILLAWIKEQQGAQSAAADGTTVDEFAQLNEAARDAFFAEDYAQALTLLLSALAAPQLGATEHAKMALNAGMAELMLGNGTDARTHFEYAAAHGQASTVQKAQARLAKMDTHDAAEQLVAEFED